MDYHTILAFTASCNESVSYTCIYIYIYYQSINPSYVMYSLVRLPVYQQADTERQTYGPFRIINCPNMHVRLDCGRKTENPDETGHMANMQA